MERLTYIIKEHTKTMNTILLDLDGTLLPMDQNQFVEIYFHTAAKKFVNFKFDPDEFMKGIWSGTKAMILNDGSRKNEECFWDTFSSIFGEEVRKLEPEFTKFYLNEFRDAKIATRPTSLAKESIKTLKSKGYKLVLATNPIFPQVATHTRMGWAGLEPEDFEIITTYENSYYCKPNLEYYKAILKTIRKEPEECMMVGNDVKEDMCTKVLGMDTYLITDCLINHEKKEVKEYSSGSFEDFMEYVNQLPRV